MVDSDLLQIYALGELRILVDGNPLRELRSRKAKALLVYLACTGKTQSREVLADLLWSESSQQQAMSNLRDVLSTLRKHLNPFLKFSRYSVGFNSGSRNWSDVEELKSATEQSQSEEMVFDHKTILDFEKAAVLYQGNLLEGFFLKDARGFNEWQLIERERIQMSVLELTLEISKYYEKTGDLKKGILFARRCIEIEPLMEAGYQQLIRLLEYRGHSTEALLQYERLRETLSNELGVEPSNDTQSLYETILSGESLPGGPESQFQHNLPLPLPNIIGRDDDIVQILKCFNDPTYRLLTLIGVGGIGKTTLGYHAAAAAIDVFPDGIWLIELASFSEKEMLHDHIASVFGVSAQEDKIGRGTMNILIEFLKDKDLLLVLDNCEHLIDECAIFVEGLLNRCPLVKILATSREVLGILLEKAYQVNPLVIPSINAGLDDIRETPSVNLFIERATLVRTSFGITLENVDVLADICRQLDGIPLAIELAASRVKVLSLYQIAERLKDRFQILTGGPRTALPRHQTLQATMDWSYNFLSNNEQAVLRRLSIFSGGWSIQGAEEVVSFGNVTKSSVLDLLSQLVDKSLVEAEEKTDKMRYFMLETVRQYGANKLTEENETRNTSLSHAEFYASLAEDGDEGLRDQRQIESLDLLDTEHENIRSALGWSIDNNEADLAFRLVGAMGWFWFLRGHWLESRRWLAKALDLASDPSPRNRAKALIRAGGLEIIRGNLIGTIEKIEEAESIYEKTGDIKGLAWCKNLLGQSKTWKRDDFQFAGPILSEGIILFQSIHNEWGVAWSLRYSGHAIEFLGEYERGLATIKESYLSFRKLGDLWNASHSALFIGNAAFRHADLREAQLGYELCLENSEQVEDRVMEAHALLGLAKIKLKQHDEKQAEVMFLNAIEALQKIGDDHCSATAQRDLAQVKHQQGNFNQSFDLLTKSLLTYVDLEFDEGKLWTIEQFAALAIAMGLGDRAARLLAIGSGHLGESNVPLAPAFLEEHNKLVEAARELVGDHLYDRFFAEGAAMSLQEAIAYALEEPPKI